MSSSSSNNTSYFYVRGYKCLRLQHLSCVYRQCILLVLNMVLGSSPLIVSVSSDTRASLVTLSVSRHVTCFSYGWCCMVWEYGAFYTELGCIAEVGLHNIFVRTVLRNIRTNFRSNSLSFLNTQIQQLLHICTFAWLCYSSSTIPCYRLWWVLVAL